MSDHLPDTGKMVGDTPRMKAAQMAAMEHGTGDVWRVGCDLERELNAANQRIKRLEESVQTAWEIIANVSKGNWHDQSPDWQDAATRWCCNDFLPSIPEAKEAKP